MAKVGRGQSRSRPLPSPNRNPQPRTPPSSTSPGLQWAGLNKICLESLARRTWSKLITRESSQVFSSCSLGLSDQICSFPFFVVPCSKFVVFPSLSGLFFSLRWVFLPVFFFYPLLILFFLYTSEPTLHSAIFVHPFCGMRP